MKPAEDDYCSFCMKPAYKGKRQLIAQISDEMSGMPENFFLCNKDLRRLTAKAAKALAELGY